MAEYSDWFQDKTILNAVVDKLNRTVNQMPSVHNDSVPVGESAEMWRAINAIELAIRALEPLRAYKKPFTPVRLEGQGMT